jgi:hypothetical protein
MDFNQLEIQIQNLINQIRADPKSIIPDLKDMLKSFKGKYYKIPNTKINVVTEEGADVVIDAINYLNAISPIQPMTEARGMYFAARDHALDIGSSGTATHEGSDKSRICERVDRYGDWDVSIAENIVFDDFRAKDIVFGMIIDDGNKSRGHRLNVLNPEFKYMGVATSEHARFKYVTVVTFAVDFKEKQDLQDSQLTDEKVQRKTTIQAQGYEGGSKKTITPIVGNSSQSFSQNKNSNLKEKVSSPLTKEEPRLNSISDIQFSNPKSKSDVQAKSSPPLPEGSKDLNEQVANWRSDPDAPYDAVDCTIKRFIKRVGKKRIIRVLKIFTLQDGSQEEIEEYKEESL